jgi:hypothetical protein
MIIRERSRVAVFAALAVAVVVPACAAINETATGSFERTLTVSGPVELEVMSGSGDIRVTSGESGSVRVVATIRARRPTMDSAQQLVSEIESNPPITQEANQIRVGRFADKSLSSNVKISYEIAVPKQTSVQSKAGSGDSQIESVRGPVEVTAGSGDVKIANIGGEARVTAGSGDILLEAVEGAASATAGSGEIRGVRIAGDFRATSGSGDVHLEQSAPGDVEIKSGSGDLAIRGVQGSVNATAASGDISAEGAPTGDWSLSSASGDVQVELSSEAAFDFRARTVSGRISVDHPLSADAEKSRRKMSGKVRGGGPLVSVRTVSGEIDVR